MVNANADALGIIFPNSYDDQVPDLVNERLMASIPFASRYRMVDFILSSMVNCGIGNTGKCSRFPEMAERKIRCYGGHQHCLQF